MSSSRRLLIIGGILLAVWGMGYGLWYAVFAEHQALDNIGASLAGSFAAAADRNAAGMETSLQQYREAKYIYDRQVDVHGHWIGLAMLLIVLGIGFGWNADELEDHGVKYADRFKVLRERVLAMKALWTEDEAAYLKPQPLARIAGALLRPGPLDQQGTPSQHMTGYQPHKPRQPRPSGMIPQFPMEVSGRANHHDLVTSPHLPGGKPGGGPPPGGKFQQRTDMGERAWRRCRTSQPKGDPP